MSSSANTFGTFLQTFSNLEQQSATPPPEAAPAGSDVQGLVLLVKDIAKTGNRSSIKSLMDASNLSKEQILSTLLSGKEKGLIEVTEENGEAVANLTSFGKLFSS
ncbi:MAG: hypothetical protein P4L76_08565 [Beijerinckiaceae bacterium]|nr:hypothetical protein [Beijerinckiaceae bacterium]